jgi:hydroxymethylglutaryl-CoA reductase
MAVIRDVKDDYTREAAEARLRAVSEPAGLSLEHIGSYCFDPGEARGNVETSPGATQVPLGFAGPLLVNGERLGVTARGRYASPRRLSRLRSYAESCRSALRSSPTNG